MLTFHLDSWVSRVGMLAGLSLGVLAGLWWAHVAPVQVLAGVSIWWVLLLAPAFLVLRRGSLSGLVLLTIVGIAGGLWRGSAMSLELQGYQAVIGTKTVMIATVETDPTYDSKGRRDFYANNVVLNGRALPGHVRVRAFGVAPVARGDTVQASGKVYAGFGNYQASMSYAQVIVLAKSSSPAEALRRQFFASIYSVLPEPLASLGLGFLVGLKTQLPDDLQTQLRALALTHIVVASGYNLTIMIRLSRRLLANWSATMAFAGSAGLMLAMLAVTGLSASMARAAVITTLALVAWFYGRVVHSAVLIVGGAAITALWNPLSFWTDLGWWLSFLAFAGVLLLAPLVTRRIYKGDRPALPLQILVETAAAQLLTGPLIMLVFGQLSILGLLANILVVPSIPLAMATTFVAGLAGLLLPHLAGWLALPAQVVLAYIVQVVRWLSGVPWASIQVSLSWPGMVILFALLGLSAFVLYRRTGFRYRQQPSILE